MKDMKEILVHAIDWTSIKLNVICMLGFVSGSVFVSVLAAIATASTIIYNTIRIYKEIKSKNNGNK